MNRRDMIMLHDLHSKQQRLEEELAKLFSTFTRDLNQMGSKLVINRNKITTFLAIQENAVIVDS